MPDLAVNLPSNGNSTTTLTGITDGGALVEVYDGTTKLGEGTANALGSWSITFTVPAGRRVTVKAVGKSLDVVVPVADVTSAQSAS